MVQPHSSLHMDRKQYIREYQIKRANERASIPSKDKVRCLICNLWYRQVGTHIVQRHRITAREYREQYGLPVKRGILPKEYRKLKSEQAINCGGVKNLKIGKKFWYKKGDERAIKNTFYKGQSEKIKKLSQEIYPYEFKQRSDIKKITL